MHSSYWNILQWDLGATSCEAEILTAVVGRPRSFKQLLFLLVRLVSAAEGAALSFGSGTQAGMQPHQFNSIQGIIFIFDTLHQENIWFPLKNETTN